jgi:hypothetical protein
MRKEPGRITHIDRFVPNAAISSISAPGRKNDSEFLVTISKHFSKNRMTTKKKPDRI